MNVEKSVDGEVEGSRLHSAGTRPQAWTLTNDGWRSEDRRERRRRKYNIGGRGCKRAIPDSGALEQKIRPSSRDLLHPLAHRLTYNLPAKHGFNLALSRYRTALGPPPLSPLPSSRFFPSKIACNSLRRIAKLACASIPLLLSFECERLSISIILNRERNLCGYYY